MSADLNALLHELARLTSILERKEAELARWRIAAHQLSDSTRELLAADVRDEEKHISQEELEADVRKVIARLQQLIKDNTKSE
jgi:hypothetical protein